MRMISLIGCVVLFFITAAARDTQAYLTMGFGSCNRHNADQSYWRSIGATLRRNRSTPADAFVWLGDVVYADTRIAPGVWVDSELEEIRSKYVAQKENEDYQQFTESAVRQVIGIWDDHDMGRNDGGKEYGGKDAVQQMFLDFLEVPSDSPRRKQQGLYAVHRIPYSGVEEHPLQAFYRYAACVILLDLRYFRDPLVYSDKGDMLGEVQWLWLENTLRELSARPDDHSTQQTCAVTLIGSGVQFLLDEKPTEQWSNFPSSRSRLLNLLRRTRTPRVIFLSGDVHMAEIAEDSSPAAHRALGYPIIDVTSSGLTHSTGDIPLIKTLYPMLFPSPYRVGFYLSINFASILLHGATDQDASVSLRIHELGTGEMVLQHEVLLSRLQHYGQPDEEWVHFDNGPASIAKIVILFLHKHVLWQLGQHQVILLFICTAFASLVGVPVLLVGWLCKRWCYHPQSSDKKDH